jgi:hypothetical protein
LLLIPDGQFHWTFERAAPVSGTWQLQESQVTLQPSVIGGSSAKARGIRWRFTVDWQPRKLHPIDVPMQHAPDLDLIKIAD